MRLNLCQWSLITGNNKCSHIWAKAFSNKRSSISRFQLPRTCFANLPATCFHEFDNTPTHTSTSETTFSAVKGFPAFRCSYYVPSFASIACFIPYDTRKRQTRVEKKCPNLLNQFFPSSIPLIPNSRPFSSNTHFPHFSHFCVIDSFNEG